jgi:hypothetical protein
MFSKINKTDTVIINHGRQNSEPAFFNGTRQGSFFTPSGAFGQGGMGQPKCAECEKEDKKKDDQNTRHFANCEGVSVQGHTDANYGHSYSAPGTSTPAKDCQDCPDDCVTNKGTVVSVFTANPTITLPDVPDGLNECEQKAVQSFINTTLLNHEKQHVAAFNKYAGTVKTPYTYKGCASGLDAHTQQIHDNLESAWRAKSDAASAALDANGANNFKIPCKCPDPEPDSE